MAETNRSLKQRNSSNREPLQREKKKEHHGVRIDVGSFIAAETSANATPRHTKMQMWRKNSPTRGPARKPRATANGVQCRCLLRECKAALLLFPTSAFEDATTQMQLEERIC